MTRPTRRGQRTRPVLIYIAAIAGVAAVLTAVTLLLAPPAPPPGAPQLTVFTRPSCRCCSRWVAHMREAGFVVRVEHPADLDAVRAAQGVSPEYAACHTTVVEGYVIEGHVPADDVKRLLRARPAALGLSVPRMPVGSPGMEGPNPQAYDVWLLRADKVASVFVHREPYGPAVTNDR